MVDVFILAEVEDEADRVVSRSTNLRLMVGALRQAIATPFSVSSNPSDWRDLNPSDPALSDYVIHLVSPNGLTTVETERIGTEGIVCPLTLDVPDSLQFPGQAIYAVCRDRDGLRQWVQRELGVAIAEGGDLWLPIALTARGALYGEVIGIDAISPDDPGTRSNPDEATSLRYHQPLHLPDRLRQPLYLLGGRLLRSHQAPPSVYLLKFGFHYNDLYFDRLFPFPAAPAIASIGVQVPNLFAAHWRCLTGQPLHDLAISGSVTHLVLQPQT